MYNMNLGDELLHAYSSRPMIKNFTSINFRLWSNSNMSKKTNLSRFNLNYNV